MKWTETIKIQAASGQEECLKEKVFEVLEGIEKTSGCEGLVKIAVARHATVPGCFALQLWWKNEMLQRFGSKTALSLIQSLKVHGLTHHSAWIEQEEKQL